MYSVINVFVSAALVLHNSGGHESFFYSHFSSFFSKPYTETFYYVYQLSMNIHVQNLLAAIFVLLGWFFSTWFVCFPAVSQGAIPIRRPHKSLACFKYFEMKQALVNVEIERSVKSSKGLKVL